MSTSLTTTTINVSGMTCEHCVASVTEELTALDGVESVHVDLKPGSASTVEVIATRPLDEAEIGEAVAEAGYLVIANNA